MKLTNEELIKMSDPNVSKDVKNYICKQKMTAVEIKICDQLGVNYYEFMITKSTEE